MDTTALIFFTHRIGKFRRIALLALFLLTLWQQAPTTKDYGADRFRQHELVAVQSGVAPFASADSRGKNAGDPQRCAGALLCPDVPLTTPGYGVAFSDFLLGTDSPLSVHLVSSLSFTSDL